MCSQNFLVWLINERSLSELQFTPHKAQRKRTQRRETYRKADQKRVQRYRVSINLNLKLFRT